MVRRDRNHPSIILWSVFNEEPMQGSEQGYEMVRRMSSLVKQLDTTRPVTAAMNGGQFTPVNVADAVDVVGFNYSMDDYDRYHAAHPDRPMTSSEDTSAFMTRGEYVTVKTNNVIASYDDERAPWGRRIGMAGRTLPRGRFWPVVLCGRDLTIAASRRRIGGQASARSLAAWTCAGFRKRPST